MPYTGMQDGETVIPPEVSTNSIVDCPVCGDEMSVVRSHYRGSAFISRHFRHREIATDDCPGESDVHLKMKSIAYSRLSAAFPDSDVELEGFIDGNFADVLVRFSEPRPPYGRGIAVEVQYRNKGKDIEGVTQHYFENSYSVAWLTQENFTDYDVDLSGIQTLWPYAIPDREGLEGYSKTIQELRTMTSSRAEVEIRLPAEHWSSWASSKVPDGWIPIKTANIGKGGRIYLSKSESGRIVFGLSKRGSDDTAPIEQVQVQVFPEDVEKIRKIGREIQSKGFGSERPSPAECEQEWHELSMCWLKGTENVTTWLKLSLPEPTSDPFIQLGKKVGDDTEMVTANLGRVSSDNFYHIARLLDQVFEIERGGM